MAKKLRALVTGLYHETNTYVPYGGFKFFTRTEGDGTLKAYRGSNTPFGGYIGYCESNDIDLVGGVMYLGNPTGLIPQTDYQKMKTDIMDVAKKAGDIDLLFVWYHGAACVEDLQDPELDLTTELKKILGDDIKIFLLAMDLHGKCSPGLNEMCTWVSSVLTYPHIDYLDRANFVLKNLPKVLDGTIKPTSYVEYIPLTFPPATTLGDTPGAKIMAHMNELNARADLLDASFLNGFPWADHHYTGAYAIVVTDNDPALAEKEAKALAKWVWDMREDLNAPDMTIDEAMVNTRKKLTEMGTCKNRPKVDLDKLATDKATQDASVAEAKDTSWGFIPDWTHKPIVVYDAADNPGGGTLGRNTWLMRRLMEENFDRTLFLDCTDTVVAKKANAAGIGAIIDIELAGGPDVSGPEGQSVVGPPVVAKAYVKNLSDGHTKNRVVLAGMAFDVGLTAHLIIGSFEIIVTSNPWQTFDNAQALIGGCDIADYKVIAIKGSAHFRAYFTPRAEVIFPADGPGPTADALRTFHPIHLRGPVYPFNLDTKYP